MLGSAGNVSNCTRSFLNGHLRPWKVHWSKADYISLIRTETVITGFRKTSQRKCKEIQSISGPDTFHASTLPFSRARP